MSSWREIRRIQSPNMERPSTTRTGITDGAGRLQILQYLTHNNEAHGIGLRINWGQKEGKQELAHFSSKTLSNEHYFSRPWSQSITTPLLNGRSVGNCYHTLGWVCMRLVAYLISRHISISKNETSCPDTPRGYTSCVLERADLLPRINGAVSLKLRDKHVLEDIYLLFQN